MQEIYVTTAEIAETLGITVQGVLDRSLREAWPFRIRQARGGGKEFSFLALPPAIREFLVLRDPARFLPAAPEDAAEEEPAFYNAESLWDVFSRATEAKRDQAAERHRAIVTLAALLGQGVGKMRALELAARQAGMAQGTLKGLWYGFPGRPGIRKYERKDWLAACLDGRAGRPMEEAECSPEAWDWFLGHYATRRQPSVADAYRRMVEIAPARGWTVPSERTIRRRLRDVSPTSLEYRRGDEKALNRCYPSQVRDKTCFAAGEAVNGDGLKFDKLWIAFEDGEILNTATGWFWQDVYSGKILAFRLGKTENTDLFRLSVYDLVDVCVPRHAWVDNTRVAANKAMTAGAKGRKRFKDLPDEPDGMLVALGIEPHFTNPDQGVSNPGVKPIERAFGHGGLHDAVASHPRFINRGFSKKTAIPVAEFRQVVAEEVARHNARQGRRSAVCGGVKSFDEAFAESFAKTTPRVIPESQRRLLLLMTEVVTADAKTGEIALKAGAGPQGKNRYWTPALAHFKGRRLHVFFDPENLSRDVHVYDLRGSYLLDAAWKPSVAFNDTETGREWAKNKRRQLKADKLAAEALTRMNDLERAALYPTAEAEAIPTPKAVKAPFGETRPKPQEREQERKMAVGAEELVLNLHAQWKKKREM